ncbi:hypothetical protein PV326_005559 [Microctonus aethiopoides]|nr:hypothetical protein PV326_005559 [Microctonus aethiopoides]
MKLCGVYFNENLPKWQKMLINTRAILTAFIAINFISIPSTVALIKVWGDLTLVIDNLIVNVPFTLSTCHFITMCYKKKEIIELFYEMKNDWAEKKTEVERKIMVRATKISQLITRYAYILVLIVIATHNLPFWILGIVPRTHTNITDGDQPLIAQTIYIYDLNVDMYYKITAIGQTMSSLIVGISYTTTGCIFYTFILHVCGQLQILRIHMEKIFEHCNNKTELDDEIVTKLIKSTVKRHQRIIKFVEVMESAFNIMFLQHFIAVTVMLSTEGFLVISILVGEVEVPVAAMVFTILYILYCASMTLIYCTGGQFLIENSIAVYQAAYNSRWYNSNRNCRVELLMIISRAQKPLLISIAKFAPVSLSSFANLIKTSASYMSVLMAVKS